MDNEEAHNCRINTGMSILLVEFLVFIEAQSEGDQYISFRTGRSQPPLVLRRCRRVNTSYKSAAGSSRSALHDNVVARDWVDSMHARCGAIGVMEDDT